MSGPHLPTCYDSDLLLLYAAEIGCLFPGVTMVADNHFRKAAKLITMFIAITNKSKAGRPRVVDGVRIPHSLSPEEEAKNSVIAGVWGRVEAPYGWIKLHFDALHKPFWESKSQHNCVVWTALACHYNILKK